MTTSPRPPHDPAAAFWVLLALALCACTSARGQAPSATSTSIALLVSAQDAAAARNAVVSVETRLGGMPGVLAVHGARSHARLFFGVRWPLYVPLAQLGQISQALTDHAAVDGETLVQNLLMPIALAQWPRANRLYAASMPYASTPDERAIAVWIEVQAGLVDDVQRTLAGMSRELAPKVRLSIDDPSAHALLFGASAPLWVRARDGEQAQRIVKRLDELQKQQADFPIREARSIDSYLPRDASAQLALSQGLRALLKTDLVASWPQRRRDAIRDLVPLPLTRLPVADDLPDYLTAVFRTRDGKLDRTLILLPRVGLDPRSKADRARIAEALTKLTVSDLASGPFLENAPVRPEPAPFWVIALSATAGLVLLSALLGRRSSRRARFVLFLLCTLNVAAFAGAWGLAAYARGVLRHRLPQLSLSELTILPWGRVDVRSADLTFSNVRIHASRLRLALASIDALSLVAEGVTLELTQDFHGQRLREGFALGDVRIDAPIWTPSKPTRVQATGGELTVALRARNKATGLSGEVQLQPALFGRLPLIEKVGELRGISLGTSSAQPIRLTSDLKLEAGR